MRAAWSSEAPARSLILESLVLQLIAELVEADASPSVPGLAAVTDALHAEFPRRPALDELAALAGFHPVHLAKAFRRRHGCSIGTYVERLRVGAVCSELTGGRRGLAEIAQRTGFADQSHMTRVFRRAVGTTPRRFRSGHRR